LPVVLSAEEVVSSPARGLAREAHGPVYVVRQASPVALSTVSPVHDLWHFSLLTSAARFGLVATLLEMIPVVSIFFTYTNTGECSRYIGAESELTRAVGAALWAADIEAMNTSMTDETAPTLREAAKKVE